MKFIDLRKEYPHLDSTYAEYPISPKIDALFEEYRLAEGALEKRRTRNGDVISLDSEPGIEAYTAEFTPGPEEEVIKRIQYEALYKAMRALPRKQADRIYAYYFMDMTLDEIAEAEGVYKSAVRKSIMLGRQQLKETLLKKLLLND